MTLIYLAHPVGGDVAGNLRRARLWWQWIEAHRTNVAVVAPWVTSCEWQDDANPSEREAGLRRCEAVVARCDELWLVGGRISAGMERERQAALRAGVKVIDLIHLGADAPPA